MIGDQESIFLLPPPSRGEKNLAQGRKFKNKERKKKRKKKRKKEKNKKKIFPTGKEILDNDDRKGGNN